MLVVVWTANVGPLPWPMFGTIWDLGTLGHFLPHMHRTIRQNASDVVKSNFSLMSNPYDDIYEVFVSAGTLLEHWRKCMCHVPCFEKKSAGCVIFNEDLAPESQLATVFYLVGAASDFQVSWH